MQENSDIRDRESVCGLVDSITYRNERNNYTVAEVKSDAGRITVVGVLPLLNEGETAEFYGEYTLHPTYGRQFKAECFERKPMESAADILRYLSTGVIRGVGPATAQKIVEKFGQDTLFVIQHHPERLASIRGISEEKAQNISKEYEKQYGVRDIMLLLSKYGVSPEKCLAVYRNLGASAPELIKKNPYILCEEGIDIPFENAEVIAGDYNIEPENEMRVAAGLEYVLRKNLLNGHTCLPRKKFIDTALRLLGCSRESAEQGCDRLTDCFRIAEKDIDGESFVSIPEYYAAEEYIAARLFNIRHSAACAVTVDDLEIDNVERKLGIKFESLQRQAIIDAFRFGILVLTGGPGTGKTTTLNAIIQLFEGREMDIQLTAPTGRAAKRMTELTGREAMTVHRLLEVEWNDEDKPQFARNEKNPLDCDVIIVDEASMIDAMLFESLLKALRLSCRVILVGDSDQLPSIGAGNVLNDILSSGVFPSIRLEKVFRQAGKSRIVTNAHAIINGSSPDFSNKDTDCFFMKRFDKQSVVATVAELCCERLPSAYGFDPVRDIQVICPSRMLDTGTVNLNNILQSSLNPLKKSEPQLYFKGFCIRVGDKVMQIKNNYDLQYKKDSGEFGSGVFNGDVGFVTDIDARAGIVKVRFDDRVATYFSEDLGQLELAYAVTVHQSQGSEFDCVILPLFDVPLKLEYRNLLYTAVTRAKKMLIIVGSESVWNEMAANNKKTLRYTMLREFIRENNVYSGN